MACFARGKSKMVLVLMLGLWTIDVAQASYGADAPTEGAPSAVVPAEHILTLDNMPTINPAEQGRETREAASQPANKHPAPFELPAVTVVGEQPGALREEDRVGGYSQPRWTVDRRFPGVRTYVVPENSFTFEYWTRADIPRRGPTEIQHLFEAEIGLPYRFQLDLYGIVRSEDNNENFFDNQIELRYAFADWGKIWGNPTLYLEYANRDQAADKVEMKLLLAGELAPGWHWGQNILFEAEVGGDREYEYGWTGGISYTVIDEKLSVGLEAQFSLFDVKGDRGTYRDETFIGPSVQYRPTPRIHLDVAPLIGVTGESPAAKLLFNFSYEF